MKGSGGVATLTCTANHFNDSDGSWSKGHGVSVHYSCRDAFNVNEWVTSTRQHSTYVSSYYPTCGKTEGSGSAQLVNFP